MEAFYQQFKENLENRPEPPFDPAAWNDLEKKIENTQKKPRTAFNWWWVATPLLLLLLISNVVLLRQLYRHNAQIDSILLQNGTITQQKFIYKIDTIYQTHTLSTPLFASNTFRFASAGSDQLIWSNQFQQPGKTFPTSTATLGNNNWNQKQNIEYQSEFPAYNRSNLYSKQPMTMELLRSKIVSFSSNTLKEEEKNSKEENLFFALNQLPTSTSPDLVYHRNWSVPGFPFNSSEVRSRKRLHLERHLLPTGFEVGGTIGGELLPETNIQGLSWGLTGNVLFGDDLRLWMEAGRIRYNVEIEQATGLFGIDNELQSPLDNYTLKSIQALPKLWYADMGLQYHINTRSVWQPFFGAGFSFLQLQPHKAEHKFTNPTTELELELYDDINTKENSSYFLSRLGMYYQWSNRINLQLSGQYRHPFNQEDDLGVKNSLTLRLALLYQL